MSHPLEKFRYCPRCGSNRFVVNNAASRRCEACGFVYYQNPRAAVAVFIRNGAGELLVCRRSRQPAAGTLDLPGGFTDVGESAEEAVVREVYEETRLRVTACRYRFSRPNRYLYSGVEIPTMDLFFDATVESAASLLASDDAAEAFFVSPDRIEPAHFGLESVAWGVTRFLSEELAAGNTNKT